MVRQLTDEVVLTKGDVQNETKLTPEQKQLVEDNHSLIYAYAKKNGLKIDDWYDVLAIGMCKAARRFDPEKGTFSTWCYRHFDNEVRTVRNDTRKKSRIPRDCIAPYESMFKGQDMSVDSAEHLIDTSAYEDTRYKMIVHDIMQDMSPIEQDVFQCMTSGYTLKMIATETGHSLKDVSRAVKSVKGKVYDYLND